jgi:hypothetical protein
MQVFIPTYSKFTYLYYPIAIGGAIWIIIASINSYWKDIISLPMLSFLMTTASLLLWWVYLFTKNKFKSIVFFDQKLLFTNVFGQETEVDADEIKAVSSIGIKIKGRILPVSTYYMDNNDELIFHLAEWMRKAKQHNGDI